MSEEEKIVDGLRYEVGHIMFTAEVQCCMGPSFDPGFQKPEAGDDKKRFGSNFFK